MATLCTSAFSQLTFYKLESQLVLLWSLVPPDQSPPRAWLCYPGCLQASSPWSDSTRKWWRKLKVVETQNTDTGFPPPCSSDIPAPSGHPTSPAVAREAMAALESAGDRWISSTSECIFHRNHRAEGGHDSSLHSTEERQLQVTHLWSLEGGSRDPQTCLGDANSHPHQLLHESSFTTSIPTSKWSEVIWPCSLIGACSFTLTVLPARGEGKGQPPSHSFYGFRDMMHSWVNKHFPLTLSVLIPYTHLPLPHPIHQSPKQWLEKNNGQLG